MNRRDRELDKELRFHLESLVQQNLAAGMTAAEARRQAVLAFGGPAQVGEHCREVRTLHWLATLVSDVRYGVRTLRASKAFTLAAVLSLALGIGSNAAIFTLLYATLWKPLPVPRPAELQHVMRASDGERRSGYSWVLYRQLQEAFAPWGTLLARGSAQWHNLGPAGAEPERVVGETVSGNYFRTLEVRPAAGRLFDPAIDLDPSPQPEIVLSHAFWTRRFHADPAAVGQVVEYDGRPFRIIGVAQPGFTGADAGAAVDVWAPVTVVDQAMVAGGVHTFWLDILARMRPGSVPAQAQAALDVRFRRHLTEEVIPDVAPPFQASLRGQRLVLRPAPSGFANGGREFERPLLVLMGVVALVLLISCANVANLVLARNVARRRELSVRVALGASRARLACQLLIESLLLALAGGAAGIVAGNWGCRLLLKLLPAPRVPLAFDLSPDATILAFTGALAASTAILCGVGPALRAVRFGAPDLNNGGLRITGRNLAGKALVVSQIALSLVLVGGAGLFLKTLYNLSSTDLGFRPEGVTSVELSYPRGMPRVRRGQITSELRERLARHSELQPTYSWPDIYSEGGWSGGIRALDNQPPPAGDNEVQIFTVGPGFFETLGIHITAGRGVGPLDRRPAPPVAVVNESFARRYFAGRAAVGHRVTMAGDRPVATEIIGVIADVKHMGVKGRVWPAIYSPALQSNGEGGATLIRSGLPVSAIASIVRAELKAVDPAAHVDRVRTMNNVVDAMITREALVASLSAAFGVLAALLAAIGLYGVMAYNMARRTAEIGIRMAVGAAPNDIRRLALRESLWMIAAGIAIGLPATFGAGRLIASLLYGMTPGDPWILAAAVALMAVVALLAGWLPAARAARIDPSAALRRT